MTANIQKFSSQKLKGYADAANMSISDVLRALRAIVEDSDLKGVVRPTYPSVKEHLGGIKEPSATYLTLYKMVFGLERLDDLFE